MSNAASTPEFKKILESLYDSGKYRTSGEVLSEAWRVYRERHGATSPDAQRKCRVCGKLQAAGETHYHGNAKGSRQHPGYKGKVGELPSEFAYKGYLIKLNHIHNLYYISKGGVTIGSTQTRKEAEKIIDQLTGPTTNPRKKKRPKPTCKHCGSDSVLHGGVCLHCLKHNPIAVYNPVEMRPRIKISKRKKRGKIGERSPLKGFKINAPGKLLPMSILEIRYQRTGGEYRRELFKHEFKSRPKVYGLPDGSLRIVSSQKLWGTVD